MNALEILSNQIDLVLKNSDYDPSEDIKNYEEDVAEYFAQKAYEESLE